MSSTLLIVAIAAFAAILFFVFRRLALASSSKPAESLPPKASAGALPSAASARDKSSGRIPTAESAAQESAAAHGQQPRGESGSSVGVTSAEPAAAGKSSSSELAVPPPAPHRHGSRPSLNHVRDVTGLRRGLERARESEGFFGRLTSLFHGRKELDPGIAADLEEVLLSSDVGVTTTKTILARVQDTLKGSELLQTDRVWDALKTEAVRILSVDGRSGAFALGATPTVVLLVGVNGAGKTTTIGKLATRLKAEGHSVLLAAGDTFRAAAVQQLMVWGQRVGVEVIRGKDGADPGSVIFEAVQAAQQQGIEIVLADTAGRLHTKANLMAELKKVVKTVGKALPGAPHEILLVIDATNGQNALAQAREFQEALPVTGVVLTKLDGTAKGGVVLGIADALGLPMRFIGLGEKANDLHDFVPEDFVEALLGSDE